MDAIKVITVLLLMSVVIYGSYWVAKTLSYTIVSCNLW